MEYAAGDEPLETGQGPTFVTQVDCYVISYRAILCDTSGASVKAAIDGCVHRGILADDSLKQIREIRNWQVKVKNKTQEKTLIVFVPVAD